MKATEGDIARIIIGQRGRKYDAKIYRILLNIKDIDTWKGEPNLQGEISFHNEYDLTMALKPTKNMNGWSLTIPDSCL